MSKTGIDDAFPEPLSGSSRRYLPWQWSVPAVTLSAASVFVFLFVFAYIFLARITREQFVIPFLDGHTFGIPRVLFAALALLAATYFLARRLQERPNGLFAKIWLLLLIAFAAIVVLASITSGLIDPTTKVLYISLAVWIHTSLFALISAISILLLRIYSPRPDSRWIQRAAPAALLFLSPFILFMIWFSGYYTENWVRDEVTSGIEAMEIAVLDKNADTDAIATIGNQLIDLKQKAGSLGDSALSGKLAESEKKFLALQTELLQKLDASLVETKTISHYQLPVIRYDFNQITYEFDAETANKYADNARYFKDVDSMLKSLRTLDSAEFVGLSTTVKEKLDNVIDNWADRWLVFLLPEIYGKQQFDKSQYINDLISRDFLSLEDSGGKQRGFSLSSLPELLSTNINVKAAAEGAKKNGCYKSESFRTRYLRSGFGIVCQAYMIDVKNNVLPLLSLRVIYTKSGQPFEVAVIVPDYQGELFSELSLDRLELLDKLRETTDNRSNNRLLIKDYSGPKRYYENNKMYYSQIILQ